MTKTKTQKWSKKVRNFVFILSLAWGLTSPAQSFEGIRLNEVDQYKRATLERETRHFVHEFKRNHPRASKAFMAFGYAQRLLSGRLLEVRIKF